jgi:DnaK suppressor protein
LNGTLPEPIAMGTSRQTPAPKSSKAAAKPAPAPAGKSASKDAKHDKPSTKAAAAAPIKSKDKVEAKADKHDKHDAKTREEPMTLPKIPSAPVSEEVVRPSITTTMNKTQLKRFRTLLEEKRDDIIKKAKQTLDEDMTLDANDLPDEMDLASSEYLQSFTFRLRGREKSFLDKIEKALGRIDDGTFGICEECGEEISVKRLEARPETTLCIRCKEDQERAEKDYG